MPDRRELLIIIDNQNNNGRVTSQLSQRLSACASRQGVITLTWPLVTIWPEEPFHVQTNNIRSVVSRARLRQRVCAKRCRSPSTVHAFFPGESGKTSDAWQTVDNRKQTCVAYIEVAAGYAVLARGHLSEDTVPQDDEHHSLPRGGWWVTTVDNTGTTMEHPTDLRRL